jgi:hypothetical protein
MIGTFMAVGFYVFLKMFDYTSVVFGQDADHELTEAEQALKTKNESKPNTSNALFQRAKGKIVIFKSKRNSKGEKTTTVKKLDSNDEHMNLAIQQGDAMVVDLDTVRYPEDEMENGRMVNGHTSLEMAQGAGQGIVLTNGVPSMKPEAQDVGGLQKPGTLKAM